MIYIYIMSVNIMFAGVCTRARLWSGAYTCVLPINIKGNQKVDYTLRSTPPRRATRHHAYIYREECDYGRATSSSHETRLPLPFILTCSFLMLNLYLLHH